MIRIYLDWNVVSNLKRSEYTDLKEFIENHKEQILIPYSPAHFNDLMKSYSPENQLFEKDLEMLEFLSGKHLLRWEENGTVPRFGTPKEYFQGERINTDDIFSLMDMEKLVNELDEYSEETGFGKLGTLMKDLYELQPFGIDIDDNNREILQRMFPNISSDSSQWDLMKSIAPFAKKLLKDRQYYKEFRKSIGENGFKVEANSGNWEEREVFDRIDNFMKEKGLDMTFVDFIKTTFEHRKEPINTYEFFTTAYLMLDMMGYKSDKLPKPTDNMQNIQMDGEHSFYAAHCDFFVVGDKKLRIKSKVLYNKFKIPTIVVEPHELIDELERVLYKYPDNKDFISQSLSYIEDKSRIVESYPYSEENEAETHAYKLPEFYFNFFNYVVYRYFPTKNILMLTFKKVFNNYSRFLFYTEVEKLVTEIVNVFGYADQEKLIEFKENMIYDNEKHVELIWRFDRGLVKLEKDEDTGRPILSYIFLLSSDQEE